MSKENSGDSARDSFAMDAQDRELCGFCSDPQNCACALADSIEAGEFTLGEKTRQSLY